MRVIDVLSAPWAIVPEKLLEIQQIYATHLRGEKIDVAEVEARIGKPLANEPKGYEVADGVAVLPLEGVISKRMNLFSQISGGTSSQLAMRDFQAAMDDPTVHSVVLLIDSPGGEVDGTQALANAIYSARGKKPIVTLADGMMASAAYWIGSAADKAYITSDTAAVGSIGVVATHLDYSGAQAARGIKVTEITAGKYKRIASENAPLTQEGRASIQDQVDHIYSVFVDAVARNRGVSADVAANEMADGRVFLGKQAINAGLVDGVSSLSTLIDQLNQQRGTAVSAVAQSQTESEESNLTDEEKLAIEAAAFARGKAEGKAEGLTEGATTERERIRAIESKSMPGHEALVLEMKFDGKTTGPEAAERILAAEQTKKNARIEALRSDAPEPVKPSATPEQQDGAKVINPAATAKAAQQYQDEQRKKGTPVTTAEAVAYVLSKN